MIGDLEGALRRTCTLLSSSRDSLWTPWSAAEVRASLEGALARLARGEAVDAAELRVLFAPTGPVQELSLANGWAEEMLVLGRTVDDLLARP